MTGTPLDDLNEAMRKLRRTYICHPDREEAVREAVSQSPLANFTEVQTSTLLPDRNAVYILQEPPFFGLDFA